MKETNAMTGQTDAYRDTLSAERQKRLEAERVLQHMRLYMLSVQIDAHFVVNTLKSVKRLADKGETEKSGAMAEGLAAILQHQHAGDALVNVFDDFQILRTYIEIMNMKHDGRYAIAFDVSDRLEACLMPVMILQPIVENALSHGLGNKEADARLTIAGAIHEETRDKTIVLTVADNGAGIAPDRLRAIRESLDLKEPGDFPEPGLRGVALANIQRRIRIRFGEGYGVTIDSTVGEGTTAKVTLPLISDL